MTQVLQIFNRYRDRSGEERIVFEIEEAFRGSRKIHVTNYFADSREWSGFGGPTLPLKLLRMFSNRKVKEDIKKKARELGVEVFIVHNVYPILSTSVYSAAQELGIPVIQYLHNYRPYSVSGSFWCGRKLITDGLKGNYWPEIRAGAWQNSVLKSLLMSMVLRRFKKMPAFKTVKRWVACSRFVEGKFIEAGADRDRLVTLMHGWEASDPAREGHDDGYYLLIARLVPEKGIRTAIEAWELLEKELGKECPKLVVAGEGAEEEFVRMSVGRLRTLRYVGYVSGFKKELLFQNCRAPLAPSVWWEPLGLVTYEAYDYGKPMLAAASGGLSETVQNGVTGLLHEPGSASDLARTIIEMEAKSVSERREMGRAGREWLLREAGYKKWREKLEQLVLDVARENKG